jgi:hypothetical protein
MKLSVDADIVLDLHCDLEAVLQPVHIAPGLARAGASAGGRHRRRGDALQRPPFPRTLTFSGVNGALWARLARRYPAAHIPQACLSATIEYRGQHDVNHALGASDARNLYRFLVRRGIISGRAGALPRLKADATPIGGMDVGLLPQARHARLSRAKGRPGAQGRIHLRGDRSGRRARGEGALPRSCRAPTASSSAANRMAGWTWPGAVLYRIAGPKLSPIARA